MRKPLRYIGLAVLAGVFVAALSAVFGASSTDPDQPPALAESDHYILHTTSRIVDGPQQQVKTWLEEVRLASFMEATDGIPGIVSTTPISGTWGENNAMRYANLDNGHTAIDRIIENRDPDLFHYQVYGFTAPSRYIVNHIEGKIVYEALSDAQTRVIWSYAIAPTSAVTRPIARNFLNRRIVPFMEQALDNMAAAAPFPRS